MVGSNPEVGPLEWDDITNLDCVESGLLILDPKFVHQARVTRAETRGPLLAGLIPLLAGGNDLEHPLLGDVQFYTDSLVCKTFNS